MLVKGSNSKIQTLRMIITADQTTCKDRSMAEFAHFRENYESMEDS